MHGQPITEPSRKMGFMFQAPVLLPWRNVEKNVLLPAEVYGLGPDAVRDKARSVIEAVGLKDFMKAYPEAALRRHAAARRARPRAHLRAVILMDEPFGALDEFTREAMNLELMRITQSAGITCIFVTHNINEAVFLSDKVMVMTPRPGEVSGIVDVTLPRRARSAPCTTAPSPI